MDRKRALNWVAIVALLTGVVALGTNVIILAQRLDESQQRESDQERRTIEIQQQLATQKASYEQQLGALRQALAAQEHANLCNEHAARRTAIEARFSDLMAAHGTLMNALRICGREPRQEDQRACALTVCGVAAWWTGGRSNCLVVAADASAIKADMERENQSTGADNCQVPTSGVLEFFN